MQHRCYECRVGRHGLCQDVGCLCLECAGEDKEMEPMVHPIKLAWLPTCVL